MELPKIELSLNVRSSSPILIPSPSHIPSKFKKYNASTPLSISPPLSYQYHPHYLLEANISNTTTSRFSFNDSQETIIVKPSDFSKKSKSSTSFTSSTSTEASFLCIPGDEIMSTLLTGCTII
jgi:hypothetical protein